VIEGCSAWEFDAGIVEPDGSSDGGGADGGGVVAELESSVVVVGRGEALLIERSMVSDQSSIDNHLIASLTVLRLDSHLLLC
jgi:hypothetical protein